ncbi:MAG: BrnT family toxin [Cyanobacteria bacterium J06623_4]
MFSQYDPNKDASNLKKHGISFRAAESAFFDPLAILYEDLNVEGEVRFILIGRGANYNLLVVVFTSRGDDTRIISARRATRSEIKDYEG